MNKQVEMNKQMNVISSICVVLLVFASDQLYAQVQTDAGAETESVGLDEIVVTARKREERLLDVPMSVSSYSGEYLELAGVENVKDLYGTAPSVFFVTGNQGAYEANAQRLVIRGIGATPIVEPGVGTFIDGVYAPDLAFDTAFIELERVEILRGPQGTLFGRNTQGGAVNMITKKPGDQFAAKVKVDFDSWETTDVQGSLSGPVSENTGMALSVRYRDSDGYVQNTALNRPQTAYDEFSARARLISELSESVQIDILVETTQWQGGQLGVGIPESGLDNYETYNSDLRDSEKDTFGSHFRLDWDFSDAMTFTSITGYRNTTSDNFKDQDGRELEGNISNVILEQGTFSQELRIDFDNSDGSWRGTMGLYYFDEIFKLDQLILAGEPDPVNFFFLTGLEVDQYYHISRDGYAAFGQATYSTDYWDFTFGARYSDESAEINSFVNYTIPFLAFFGIPPTTAFFQNANANDITAFSPMASLSYRPSESMTLYATIADGFKAGGFQFFQANPGPEYEPFDSETSRSYELGLKTELADRRLRVNASVYLTEIKDQQITVNIVDQALVFNGVFNIGESETKGFELEFAANPLESLTLSGSYSFTDTEFINIDIPPGADPSSSLNDLAGQPFSGVPEQTWSLSANYLRPINSDLDFGIYAEYRNIGDQFDRRAIDATGSLLNFSTDGYEISSLRVFVQNERWNMTVYSDNIFDTNPIISKNLLSAEFLTEPHFVLLAPRRTGINVTYRF